MHHRGRGPSRSDRGGEGAEVTPYSAEVCLLMCLAVFGIATFFEYRRLKKLVERERNRFLKSDDAGDER